MCNVLLIGVYRRIQIRTFDTLSNFSFRLQNRPVTQRVAFDIVVDDTEESDTIDTTYHTQNNCAA